MSSRTSLEPRSRTRGCIQSTLFQSGDGGGTDHAAIGDDADTVDGKAAAQTVDHRDQGGDIRSIAGPHLRADGSPFLVDDDADDHLVQVRPVILGVAALAERGTALALEIQRGGVHEHHREIGEQRAPTGEQPLLDKILDAARNQGSAVLLGRGQFLAKPGHGAVEVMELQAIDTGDAVVAAPLIAGAVGAGDHQPVQDGKEDGSLDGKLEAATSKQFLHDLAAPCVAPQTFEQQWRADAPAGERRRAALIGEGQDHRTLGEACGGSRQAVKITATFDVFLAPKIADDALPGPAILTDGLYQVDVGVAANALFTDEHGASIRSGADLSS